MSDYKKRIETLNENDYVQVETILDCVDLSIGCENVMGTKGYSVIMTKEEAITVAVMLLCATGVVRQEG